MKSEDLEFVKAKIIRNLCRKRKYGHAHTSIDNAIKNFDGHMGATVKKCVNELINRGLILKKPTSYGVEISLNVEKAEEIKGYLTYFLDNSDF